MKHTPGPWTTETFVKTGIEVTIVHATKGWAKSGMANRRTVAEVGHWKDRPNPEADAYLIAAAPELLEALEGLLDDLPGVIADCMSDDGALDKANAAIAKAKGE